jgi:cell division protein FtsQ
MKAYARLLTLLGLTSMLALAIYLGAQGSWSRLQPIVVAGPPAGSPLIQKNLEKRLQKFSGEWVWKVSLRDVLSEVEKDRRIQVANVRREFPNRLVVDFSPHKAIMALIDDGGRAYPIAADASLLPALPSAGDVGDMPLLRGRNFREDAALRAHAIAIWNELPLTGLLSTTQLSEISYSAKEGFSLWMMGGTVVRIGDEQIGLKASRVERVLKYLNDQQLRGRVIDARFAKKVVVRLRNDP